MPRSNKRRQLIVLAVAACLTRAIGEKRLLRIVTLLGLQTALDTVRMPDSLACRREDAAAGLDTEEAGL